MNTFCRQIHTPTYGELTNVSLASGLTYYLLQSQTYGELTNVSLASGLTYYLFQSWTYGELTNVSLASGLTYYLLQSWTYGELTNVSLASGLTYYLLQSWTYGELTNVSLASGLTYYMLQSWTYGELTNVSLVAGLTYYLFQSQTYDANSYYILHAGTIANSVTIIREYSLQGKHTYLTYSSISQEVGYPTNVHSFTCLFQCLFIIRACTCHCCTRESQLLKRRRFLLMFTFNSIQNSRMKVVYHILLRHPMLSERRHQSSQ